MASVAVQSAAKKWPGSAASSHPTQSSSSRMPPTAWTLSRDMFGTAGDDKPQEAQPPWGSTVPNATSRKGSSVPVNGRFVRTNGSKGSGGHSIPPIAPVYPSWHATVEYPPNPGTQHQQFSPKPVSTKRSSDRVPSSVQLTSKLLTTTTSPTSSKKTPGVVFKDARGDGFLEWEENNRKVVGIQFEQAYLAVRTSESRDVIRYDAKSDRVLLHTETLKLKPPTTLVINGVEYPARRGVMELLLHPHTKSFPDSVQNMSSDDAQVAIRILEAAELKRSLRWRELVAAHQIQASKPAQKIVATTAVSKKKATSGIETEALTHINHLQGQHFLQHAFAPLEKTGTVPQQPQPQQSPIASLSHMTQFGLPLSHDDLLLGLANLYQPQPPGSSSPALSLHLQQQIAHLQQQHLLQFPLLPQCLPSSAHVSASQSAPVAYGLPLAANHVLQAANVLQTQTALQHPLEKSPTSSSTASTEKSEHHENTQHPTVPYKSEQQVRDLHNQMQTLASAVIPEVQQQHAQQQCQHLNHQQNPSNQLEERHEQRKQTRNQLRNHGAAAVHENELQRLNAKEQIEKESTTVHMLPTCTASMSGASASSEQGAASVGSPTLLGNITPTASGVAGFHDIIFANGNVLNPGCGDTDMASTASHGSSILQQLAPHLPQDDALVRCVQSQSLKKPVDGREVRPTKLEHTKKPTQVQCQHAPNQLDALSVSQSIAENPSTRAQVPPTEPFQLLLPTKAQAETQDTGAQPPISEVSPLGSPTAPSLGSNDDDQSPHESPLQAGSPLHPAPLAPENSSASVSNHSPQLPASGKDACSGPTDVFQAGGAVAAEDAAKDVDTSPVSSSVPSPVQHMLPSVGLPEPLATKALQVSEVSAVAAATAAVAVSSRCGEAAVPQHPSNQEPAGPSTLMSYQSLLSLTPSQPLALACVNRADGQQEVVVDVNVLACSLMQLNITKFLECVTPVMKLKVSKGRSGCEEPSFCLRDLWRFYDSPCGIEMPLTTESGVSESAFFAPHLSGFQLFHNHEAHNPWAEWYSQDAPESRIGLWERVEELADEDQFKMLMSARSTALSHHSWYAVTWSPIICLDNSRRGYTGTIITYHLLRPTRPAKIWWWTLSSDYWRMKSEELCHLFRGDWRPPHMKEQSISGEADTNAVSTEGTNSEEESSSEQVSDIGDIPSNISLEEGLSVNAETDFADANLRAVLSNDADEVPDNADSCVLLAEARQCSDKICHNHQSLHHTQLSSCSVDSCHTSANGVCDTPVTQCELAYSNEEGAPDPGPETPVSSFADKAMPGFTQEYQTTTTAGEDTTQFSTLQGAASDAISASGSLEELAASCHTTEHTANVTNADTMSNCEASPLFADVLVSLGSEKSDKSANPQEKDRTNLPADCSSWTAYSEQFNDNYATWNIAENDACEEVRGSDRGTIAPPTGSPDTASEEWPQSVYVPVFGFIPYKLATSTWFLSVDQARAMGVSATYRDAVPSQHCFIGPLHFLRSANELASHLKSEYNSDHADYNQCIRRMPQLQNLLLPSF